MTDLWKKIIAEAPDKRELALKSLDNAVEYAENTKYVSPERLAKLASYVDTIRSNAAALENFVTLFNVYHKGAPDDVLLEPFPEELGAITGEKELLFVLAMSLIPTAEECFMQAGIPVEKLHQSYDEIEAWLSNCERNYGVTGLEFWHGFAWLTMRLFTVTVIRFGRLEYNKCKLFPDVMVLRNRKTGENKVVLTQEYELNKAGLFTAPGEENAAKTTFNESEDGTVTANCVSPDGIVSLEAVRFDAEEWEISIRPGDNVIYMHIPEVGPLKIEDVRKSLAEVREFYDKYYPDYKGKAIVSHSWLFDPVLKELLPESSNLIQYQKTGLLIPQKGPSDAVRRVLGQVAVDKGIDAVEWESSLQKSLGKYLANGGFCRGGGIIIPF